MKNFLLFIYVSLLLSSSPYVPLTNSDIYSIVEYEILISDEIEIFVLNQPYSFNQIEKLISNPISNHIINHSNYWKNKTDEKINIGINPNLNNFQNKQYLGLELNGVIKIKDLFFVNEIDLNEKYKFDSEFHGDTSEWLMGYFNSSYAQLNRNNVEIFAGRISRNFGSLNDYGLILSNNPYAFDHYGFSVTGKKLKYSFYTTRLNDMDGIDNQGILISEGDILNTHRFWAIQRLDYKKNNDFQISFSEAIVYGGPNQQFVASYLSPTHFYYSAQRNQQVQLNSFWQVNIFYKPLNRVGIYLDLFVDDIIVNNDPNENDRAKYPDRLAFLIKGSYAFNQKMYSLRYVKIWNETYLSHRNFENYIYFNKGIGYPKNSFESIKFIYNSLRNLPMFFETSLELWRHGDRNLSDTFVDELNSFPAGIVSQGFTGSLKFSYYFCLKNKLSIDYNVTEKPKDWNNGVSSKNDYNLILNYTYYFTKTI